jgi:type IV pilus assembly protein PilV
MKANNQSGFTLLEVLVALLIFSLGLIGLAGLLTVSVKTNQSAYLRTQATFIAQSMADRMHANSLGLWKTSYNLNSIASPAAPPATPFDLTNVCAGTGAPCDYDTLADRDLKAFQNQLITFLPNPKVGVACTAPASTPSTADLESLPPYSNTCEIVLQWSEIPITGQDSTKVQPEVFDWVFQP